MVDLLEMMETVLPAGIDWDRYTLIKINKTEDDNIKPFTWRVEFIIEEKNTVPPWLTEAWENVESKWFFPPKKIHDFPVRSKIWTITVKRRRWIKKETKEYISKELDVNYPWTLTEKELVSFLK